MKPNILGGLLATLLAVGAVGAVPTGASAIDSGSTARQQGNPTLLARESARNLISSKAPQLKISAGERFQAKPVIAGGGGVQYAPYTRTYEGLQVRGGDFVVATDSEGRIVNTTVAQSRRIGDLSLTPLLGKAKAKRAAAGTVDKVTRVGAPEKIIDAIGKPALAWKVRVNGTSADGDREIKDVYVDARSGKVRGEDVVVHFADGTGTGFYNGPAPLTVRTTQNSATSFSMVDADIPGVSCRDDANNVVYTGADNAWGNGAALDKETGCVDSLFAIQNQDRMMSAWLGGNGFDTRGNGWMTRVGRNVVNAFYCPPGAIEPGYCDGTQWVVIGRNSANNRWLTTLDVLGHEYGHGIDTNTPGGISGSGTQEFVGDVLGTLSEHYANQSTTYDEPDYLIGEEAGVSSAGVPIRNMYNPGALGHPNCYSSSIPSTEVHAAAGPGNHWFYLLAEGTNPVGKPASTTCNGSTNLSGIGIQAAGKIFYNAMLMKTAGGSYLKYRVWTLQAAKNLYPGSCDVFNKVKAAWDAVSVGAQAGEATCSTTGNTVTVTNPGSRTATVGTAASLQMTGTSSGSGQTLTWSATGLPAGLAINATTGLISGTPTTAATYNVTVTARDTTNAQGTTSFTWTVNPVGGGTTVTLANTIALDNCSASLVRFPTSVGTDPALMLTNGHCIGSFPAAGQVIKDQASSRTGTLLRADGTSAGTLTANRLLYATMTDTDAALYRLTETFDAVLSRTGGTPYTIANARPADGSEIGIPSGYWKRVYNCSVNGFTNLKEGQWTWRDSIRYSEPGCDVIGGTSGSPIIGKASGQVVGVNNTTNESGQMCTDNNPCEVAADGTTTAHQGTSYGQQTYWFTTCVNSSRQLDLTVSGCMLPGASTPANTVTVTNPGNKTGVVGTPISSIQITGSSTGGGSLTYTATGLPAGLTISTSGLITGTPTTAGTSTVVVTGRDSTNATGSTTFTFTISGTGGGGTCTAQTNGTDVAITDGATVESPVTLSGCTGNASATSKVAVNIVHTYIGDLKVDLVAPDGTVYNLHNRTGDGADNINTTYTKDLSSEVANGTWKLRVYDGGYGDVGKIDTWTLTAGTAGSTCAPQTNAADVAISDGATVESPVTLSGCSGNASATSKVAVSIVHTYIGDLKVDLVAPDGTVYNLHNRTGDGADNINTTYTVDLSSEVANGTWKLRVYDGGWGDVGKIDTWTLTP